MANNNNDSMTRAQMAGVAAVSRRTTESIIGNVMNQYQTQRNVHSVGGTNDDRQAKKDEYIEEQRHQKQLAHEQKLLTITNERIEAEKAGNVELVQALTNQIRQIKIEGPDSIGFDTDEVSINISSTLEEIASNFSDLSRAEQKAEIARMEELKKMIAESNATEKQFLISQTENLLSTAQSEYDKRATIAARALEKSSELAEQYMDVNSLYSGFVDHNPVMMALWNIGGDFIRRWRTAKKHQRESISRDRSNMEAAETLNERKAIREDNESRRDDEINTVRQQILDSERQALEQQGQKSDNKKARAANPEVAAVDGFDASGIFDGIQSDDEFDEPVIRRDRNNPTTFDPEPSMEMGGDAPIDIASLMGGIQSDDDYHEQRDTQSSNGQANSGDNPFAFPEDEYSGTGDEPLTQGFMSELFGTQDEDGDETGFTIEREEPAPVEQPQPTMVRAENTSGLIKIDDSQPVNVTEAGNEQPTIVREQDTPVVKINDMEPVQVRMSEESPEQKAQALFVRQDAERNQRDNQQFQAETAGREEQIITKLSDIEDATTDGNKIAKKNGKALDKLDDGGLLEKLGLGRVAALFKGPILKALMMFAPAVTAIGGLLAKFGMGGIADKLTGGFDDLTERMGGDKEARTKGKNGKPGKPTKGGKFARAAKGGKGLFGRVLGGAGKLARGAGGMLARGAGFVGRGALGLLGGAAGTAASGILAAGAAGYGIGSLLNEYVIPDSAKESIGDFIGPKIDSVLSFFGNDEAEQRLKFLEEQKQRNAQTMGVKPSPKVEQKTTTIPEVIEEEIAKAEKSAPNIEPSVTPEPKVEESFESKLIKSESFKAMSSQEQIALLKSVKKMREEKFKREGNGAPQLAATTPVIEYDQKGMQNIEVPVQKKTEEKLQMLEEKVVQLADAKAEANNNQNVIVQPPAKRTQQKVVQSASNNAPVQTGRSARNSDSSIQRVTDRFVGMGMA